MTSAKKIKRVAALHDLSGFGRCALTVVIPALSAMGIQVVPLPTALLSTHTGGFTDMYFEDLTHAMKPIAAHWKNIGITFDAIYTGFLASAEQAREVENFISEFKSPDCSVLVDPVFADDGELYQCSDHRLVDCMKSLCTFGDIIVPNITEACYLTDTKQEDTTKMSASALAEYITDIMQKLSRLGAKKIAVTGILTKPDGRDVTTAGIDLSDAALDNSPFFVNLKRLGGSYPGTGELFASVMLGKLLRGANFSSSVAAASAFTRDVIDFSLGFDTPLREGVTLEPCLARLATL